jgi:hypothetical protein
MARAAFDMIGLAGKKRYLPMNPILINNTLGFDYAFNAIQNEENPVYIAYKRMFGMTLDQERGVLSTMMSVYFPAFYKLFVSVQKLLYVGKDLDYYAAGRSNKSCYGESQSDLCQVPGACRNQTRGGSQGNGIR